MLTITAPPNVGSGELFVWRPKVGGTRVLAIKRVRGGASNACILWDNEEQTDPLILTENISKP